MVLTGHRADPPAEGPADTGGGGLCGVGWPDPGSIVNRMEVAGGPAGSKLRVRIAEVQRTLVTQLGINWQVLNAHGGNFTFRGR